MEENFGFAKPIGSRQIKIRNCGKYLLIQKLYLNAGIGVPCAGHVRAMPSSCLFSKADRDKMDENFGLENPIGSRKHV